MIVRFGWPRGGPRFWSSATPEDRQTNYAEIIVRPAFDNQIPGAIVDTRTLETGKPVGLPIQVRVSGEDIVRLREQAAKPRKILRDIPIAAPVRDDWGEKALHQSVSVDVDRANLAGVSNFDVLDAVKGALTGQQAGTLRDGDKEIPVLARLRMEERSQLSDLHNLIVFSSQDEKTRVPLQQVASRLCRS